MTDISFDAMTQQMPKAPAGTRLVSLSFGSCPGSSLRIRLTRCNVDVVDDHGISADAWWKITCDSLPDRSFRTTHGTRSVSELLRRYGFQDASGCVNHRKVIAHYDTTCPKESLDTIPADLRDATGVPQFYRRSGVCWFCAMCWTSMANEQMRQLVASHIPDETFRGVCERAIYDRDSAESFRKRLWFEMNIGDNVEMPPEVDGQNGFSQFCILCAKLGIPMYRLREEQGEYRKIDPRIRDQKGQIVSLRAPKGNEEHVLALRFQDGDHQRFPLMRRINYRGKRYRLVGVYMGQRKCGHQIAISSPSGSWRDWSIADADLHKDGIGPMFINFEGKKWQKDWWKAWGELVHVTKFGMGNSQFCSLSPHNPKNDALDSYENAYRGSTALGTNSLDILYLPTTLAKK